MTAPSHDRVFAVIAGGGTGGHVYPAIAVADELVRRGHPRAQIRFVGSVRGLEATAVPAAGYAVTLLPGRGLRRSVRPAALAQNLRTVLEVVLATARAIGLVRRWRPAVVLGMGGYAAAPVVLAAALARVPMVVHEQNAAPGVVNRIAVALRARAAVSLPGTRLGGATLTGNPVRAEIAAAAEARGRPRAVAGRRVAHIGVVGGSLGARRLNDATLALAARWRDRGDVAIRHVAGRRDYERCVDEWARTCGDAPDLDYRILAYEDDMAGLYAWSDVVVTRAGAVTVAEIAVTGTPAVVVPLPGAPSGHQSANAAALAAAGAAVVLDDRDCDADHLARLLQDLLGDRSRLEAMGAAARAIARPDAAARVADLVEEAARAR